MKNIKGKEKSIDLFAKLHEIDKKIEQINQERLLNHKVHELNLFKEEL